MFNVIARESHLSQHGIDMISLIRKVAFSVLFLLSLVWYGSTHFYRDPGSVVFNKAKAFEQRSSKHRMAEVRQLINDLKANPGQEGQQRSSATNANLCVTTSSVNRKGSSYLEVGQFRHLQVSWLTYSDYHRQSSSRFDRSRKK